MSKISQKGWFLALIGIVLVAALVAGVALLKHGPAVAQSSSPSDLLEAPEAYAEFNCTIGEVAVFTDRIHVYCNPPAGAIFFFAAPAAQGELIHTNRFLVLLNTAYALGKPVVVGYDTDSAHNPPSCLAVNCRKILAIKVR
ncbi:MAG: hypothetical protein ACM3PY_17470 [Omnitrophica WOR_2 bacterium]